ncbi:MAG: YczE/YyaS/YitT family protein [Acetobacterium sp.]
MSSYILRFLKLNFGLFLYGLGIIITMRANVGYAPWEVLHSGISQTLGVSIGLINTSVGAIIVVISCLLGEKIGIGTIFNMFMIGLFMDLILFLNFIPLIQNFWIGSAAMIFGLFIIALGTYFYISSSFGAGPRDSLMVAITRKTKLPVGLCRGILEVSVVIIGWFLGGQVGLGTVLSAFAIGICVQIIFSIFNFDPTKAKHETFGVMAKNLQELKKV